eukprot:CAMPEP_0184483840 /NCGR_PEP_ID=MMETSP0113_2-20130426/5506_1 /TAXON_ID=91329 /ORGANISM="Norrisiella sphaerica, Strain BC52" /LENGTH=475 /DNA_ID=CAMNT_0026864473 /DNA_START=682 /DNA_END=2109 /DNA_ORIENTATION=+
MKKTIRIPELIVQSWPVRHQCVQGIWKSTKPLTTISGRTDPKRDILHIAVFDYSHPNGEDIVGYTSLKISELAQKSKLRVKVPLAYDPIPFFPADLSVTLKLAAPPPQRKTIFLLRHAKSIWNRAQETDLGVSAVFSEDHPLHEEGIKQAESLRTQIRLYASGDVKTSNGTRQGYMNEFLNADTILCSPLSRAVQTAVIAMQDHPLTLALAKNKLAKNKENPQNRKNSPPIKLLSCIREKRNFGSRDCISLYKGQEIVKYSQRHLDKFYGETASKSRMYPENDNGRSDNDNATLHMSCKELIDVHDATDEWWDDGAESKAKVLHRIQDFIDFIRYSPSQRIVVVGHSIWMRSFLDECMSKSLRRRVPELASEKIMNCGVFACDMIFGGYKRDAGRFGATITAAEPLFSTELQSKWFHVPRGCTPSSGRRKRNGSEDAGFGDVSTPFPGFGGKVSEDDDVNAEAKLKKEGFSSPKN